jgi:hypothetical protein
MSVKWLHPWYPVANPQEFLDELRLEVTSSHPLFDLPLRTIARRYDRDDVLFQIEDGSGRVAMVHLTWSMKPERDPFWPETIILDSLNRWAETVMTEDYQDLVSPWLDR